MYDFYFFFIFFVYELNFSSLVSTVCLPQLQSYLDAVLSAINMGGVIEALEDLEATWTIALACMGIALGFG